jgi:hypothetical protein
MKVKERVTYTAKDLERAMKIIPSDSHWWGAVAQGLADERKRNLQFTDALMIGAHFYDCLWGQSGLPPGDRCSTICADLRAARAGDAA